MSKRKDASRSGTAETRRPDLYGTLEQMGLLEYGSSIKGSLVREIAGIDMPEVGTREQFSAVQLEELGVVDRVKTELLRQGKYLASDNGNYRILTAAENAGQVETYMRHADNKLRRAIILSNNSPSISTANDNTAARMMIKRSSIQRRINRLSLTN